VLDLCCAPGLKLCAVADLVPPSSVVVGVDISKRRISLCKNIIKKYHIDDTTFASRSAPIPQHDDTNSCTAEKHGPVTEMNNNSEIFSPVTIRLYCADGTTFGVRYESREQQSTFNEGLVFDSNIAMEEVKHRGKRKRLNKSARAREKRKLLDLHRRVQKGVEKTYGDTVKVANAMINNIDTGETISLSSSKKESVFSQGDVGFNETQILELFDRVLVDAECSTDGAVRHIEKRRSSPSNQSCNAPAWNELNMSELVHLQKQLIESGFNLLRKGGVMVYSTCSLSNEQNEEVVQWLLNKHESAFMIAVSFKRSEEELEFMEEGSLKGTVRFQPSSARDSSDIEETVEGHIRNLTFSGGGFFLAKIGKA